MDHRPPPAIGARTAAGGLTLVVHGLLVTALLMEDRDLIRPLPASRAAALAWIHLASIRIPPAVESARRERSATAVRAIAPRGREIVVAPPPAQPAQPASDSIAEEPVPPPSDWELLAQQRGGTYGRETDRTTFSAPVEKMRKPCRPRDSSFEWSPAEERSGLYPLPYVLVGERCVIGLGFLGCALGEMPPPNKHLFDDMQKGLTAKSVPDPDSCD